MNSLKTNEWKLAYRIVFWSLVTALIIVIAVIEFMPPGDERNLLRSIGLGIGWTAMIAMIIHKFKPEWFRPKVKHHPDENIGN